MTHEEMNIKQLAAVVEQDWQKVSLYARPYLDAMHHLEKATDSFYLDSADSIVLYFLCNASSWRGEVAKSVKSALKKLIA